MKDLNIVNKFGRESQKSDFISFMNYSTFHVCSGLNLQAFTFFTLQNFN